MTPTTPCTALAKQSPTEEELRRLAAVAWRSHWFKFWWNLKKKVKVRPLEEIDTSPKFIDIPIQGAIFLKGSYYFLDTRPLSSKSTSINFITHVAEKSPASPPQCRGCKNHYGRIHGGNLLVCALHPSGVEGECSDFEAGSNNPSRSDDRHLHSWLQLALAPSNPDDCGHC
jgi:hypothetical protein